MTTPSIELSNVIYNAADQSFEAMATIRQAGVTRKLACAINAPIQMPFEDAAQGLMTHALRNFSGRPGLASQYISDTPAPQRAGRAERKPQKFDAFAMLRRLAA